MITLEELKERLIKQFDEIGILEALEINSEDLVNAFSDRIEDRYDWLVSELEEVEGNGDV